MLAGALDTHHTEFSDREAPRRARLAALGRWVGGGVDWLARVWDWSVEGEVATMLEPVGSSETVWKSQMARVSDR